MSITFFSRQQELDRLRFRAFVDRVVCPAASVIDREEHTPEEIIQAMGGEAFLGALAPTSVGGAGMDWVTFGILNEELGRGCSSLRSLVTVHSMVIGGLTRWGTDHQKRSFLEPLARGRMLGAFALTEDTAGSDASAIVAQAVPVSGGFVLRGSKRWITYGQRADLFLVFAKVEGQNTAFLVRADSAGLRRTKVRGLLGLRGSMAADLDFEDCFVPSEQKLGGVAFGNSLVASSCLEYGRYSVAWGCVGVAQACFEASLAYAKERCQFGKTLDQFQLVRRMLSDMRTNVHAARLMCLHAGALKDAGNLALVEISMAKYFSSVGLVRSANDAVQIHGAHGCGESYPVQRYLRDAKVMEIIEGSTQIHQLSIGVSPGGEATSP